MMLNITQTCRCGHILHPDPSPGADRYRPPMLHPDGREECSTDSHQGLPEHLAGS